MLAAPSWPPIVRVNALSRMELTLPKFGETSVVLAE